MTDDKAKDGAIVQAIDAILASYPGCWSRAKGNPVMRGSYVARVMSGLNLTDAWDQMRIERMFDERDSGK